MLRLMEEHVGGEKVFRIGWVRTKRSVRGLRHITRSLCVMLAEVVDYPFRIDAQAYLIEIYVQHGCVRK